MVSALVCDATMRISYGVKKMRKHLLPRPALTSPITSTSRAAAAVLMLLSSSSARGQDVGTRHLSSNWLQLPHPPRRRKLRGARSGGQ